ncbi:MAG TPA: hypothetical protein PK154_00320 [Methanoregulaceae archaeon]|nr:hypothetical protein [Methanoregulaceae archaeon]HPW09537.1 hypothetical protein [Methanoregulaceae archaeon]
MYPGHPVATDLDLLFMKALTMNRKGGILPSLSQITAIDEE